MPVLKFFGNVFLWIFNLVVGLLLTTIIGLAHLMPLVWLVTEGWRIPFWIMVTIDVLIIITIITLRIRYKGRIERAVVRGDLVVDSKTGKTIAELDGPEHMNERIRLLQKIHTPEKRERERRHEKKMEEMRLDEERRIRAEKELEELRQRRLEDELAFMDKMRGQREAEYARDFDETMRKIEEEERLDREQEEARIQSENSSNNHHSEAQPAEEEPIVSPQFAKLHPEWAKEIEAKKRRDRGY